MVNEAPAASNKKSRPTSVIMSEPDHFEPEVPTKQRGLSRNNLIITYYFNLEIPVTPAKTAQSQAIPDSVSQKHLQHFNFHKVQINQIH